MYREDIYVTLVLTLVRIDLLFYWGGSQNLDTTKDVRPAPINPTKPTNGIWTMKVDWKCHIPHYYHDPARQGINMRILAQTPRLR